MKFIHLVQPSPLSIHGAVSPSHTVPIKPHSLPVPPSPAPGSQATTVLPNREFDSFRSSRPTVAVLLRLVCFTLHSVLEVSSVLYHVSEFPPFLRLSNTPSCKRTRIPFCVSVLLLADAGLPPRFGCSKRCCREAACTSICVCLLCLLQCIAS